MALEVAAAVIQRADGAFLLARRPAGKVYAGYWEFPGGKIEPGEPAERAVARELREELGIEPESAYPWLTREYVYPHAAVRLHFFRVTSWRGAPHPHEGQEIAWQRHGEPLVAPMLPANAPVLAALALPHEYAVTDATRLGVARMLQMIRRRLAEGLRLIQVRDRSLVGRDAFVQDVVALARPYGAKVLVSGGHRLGDGAHYTAAQLGTLAKRPHEGLVAASCHDAGELARAADLGLDFAALGPVKPTATHPDAAPLGWERFAELVRGATIPVFAIGGLSPSDMESAWRAGAHGLAMVRGSWGEMRNVV
ncbi:MAG: Nudix family hydrolase [Betaproteobacteria bacterium]|nr:Nudix family hydrolase [Betaproteobacteria bacterium]MDH5220948.1 Nudix family hydrolase [Betaproteobacteria bacterium]MDH5350457.1 Nudix family hydrolase [Betaproteobacteria bacterium]